MNDTIALLKAHRSIRKFTEQAITGQQLQEIIEAGQCAATSSFLQGVTVIRVTQKDVREQFVELAGNQPYIASAAEFLVFCADLNRARRCCEMHNAEAVEGFTEQFIIATVDVALMAQNAVVAAESMGLGICYIGGIRNDPQRAAELLQLPGGVYPVFGLCIGHPAQDPETKPRLPVSVVLKNDTYSDSTENNAIREYDQHVQRYYQQRTGGKKEMGWSDQIARLLSKESRPHMRAFLEKQGFEFK